MSKLKSGWTWIPTLYLYQGIPYSIVMTTSALIYTNMGISISSFVFWTSLLYLPWTIKPLWSPFVESFSTKRQWIVATQFLVALAFIALGSVMQMELFYPISLLIFAFIAFGSASHDIACDGFYMLALNKHDQSFFVGIRTTFYRIAMLAALGLLPQLAGYVQQKTGMTPLEISISNSHNKTTVNNGTLVATYSPTHNNDTLLVSLTPATTIEAPLVATIDITGRDSKNYSIVGDTHLSFADANDTKTIAVATHKNAPSDSTLSLKVSSGNIALGWTVALAALGVFLLLLTVWNKRQMPRPPDNAENPRQTGAIFVDVLRSFFTKPGAAPAICFLLLYRLGEAQLAKIATPFLIDDRVNGGLALSMMQYGFVYGTAGMIALTIGGIAGGWLAARYGLRRMIWTMVAFMNLPNLVYVALAHFQPLANEWTIYGAVVLEQLGYGFGFTAYMLFMLHYVGESKYKTAEYALATTIMALGMMLPGMISGYMKELMGYEMFFVYVVICCIPGTILVKFLNLDKNGA